MKKLLVVLYLFVGQAFVANAKEQALGYRLKVDNSIYTDMSIVVDKTRSKLKLRNERGELILKPPYQLKTVLNPENKLYYPLALFGIGPTDERLYLVGKLSAPVKTKLFKLNCWQYTFKVRDSNKIFYRANLITTNDLKFHSGLNTALSRVLGLENVQGFPLRYVVQDRNKKSVSIFNVSKIEKMKIEEAAFLIPPSYKKAKSLAALVFSEDGKFDEKEFNELFRSKF